MIIEGFVATPSSRGLRKQNGPNNTVPERFSWITDTEREEDARAEVGVFGVGAHGIPAPLVQFHSQPVGGVSVESRRLAQLHVYQLFVADSLVEHGARYLPPLHVSQIDAHVLHVSGSRCHRGSLYAVLTHQISL